MNPHAVPISKVCQMGEGTVAADDARRNPRTHILLVAALHNDHRTVPVRVRNLSPHGALLEGEDLPSPGHRVILRRGKLEAAGRVVRATTGRAGIQFDHSVHVQAWLPVKGSPAQRPVDQFAATLANSGGLASPVAADMPRAQSRAEIAGELKSVMLGLVALGDKLANDRIVVATHPEVQFIDSAVQRIAKLVDVLNADNASNGRTSV